jgi:hypothetical protein
MVLRTPQEPLVPITLAEGLPVLRNKAEIQSIEIPSPPQVITAEQSSSSPLASVLASTPTPALPNEPIQQRHPSLNEATAVSLPESSSIISVQVGVESTSQQEQSIATSSEVLNKLIFVEEITDQSCLQKQSNPDSSQGGAAREEKEPEAKPTDGIMPSSSSVTPPGESPPPASPLPTLLPTAIHPPGKVLSTSTVLSQSLSSNFMSFPMSPPLLAIDPILGWPRKRSNSDVSPNPITNTKKPKPTPPPLVPPARPATAPKKRRARGDDEEEEEKQKKEESEEEEEDEWNYFSVLVPTDVLPAKYFHLRSFIGRRFTDLEVPKNDPFKYGCVTDIVQLHGKGPYLFKFYNYLKFPKKAPPENEDDWAYQGCDELIADYENKKNPTYFWR